MEQTSEKSFGLCGCVPLIHRFGWGGMKRNVQSGYSATYLVWVH